MERETPTAADRGPVLDWETQGPVEKRTKATQNSQGRGATGAGEAPPRACFFLGPLVSAKKPANMGSRQKKKKPRNKNTTQIPGGP